MTDDDKKGLGLFICIAVVVLWVAVMIFSLGYHLAQRHERTEAIKANAGHWIADEKTGEPEFRYGD